MNQLITATQLTMSKSKLAKPKNGREIAPRNCMNCKLNIYDKNQYSRVCTRSGEPEWGEPEDMSNYVCDGFKRYKLTDANNNGGE